MDSEDALDLLSGVISLKRMMEEAGHEEQRRAIAGQFLGSQVVRKMVGLMLRDDELQLKMEATELLTTLSTGTKEDCNVLVES